MKLNLNIKITIFVLLLIWSVYLFDIILPFNIKNFGIIPRELTGLWGIVFAPFIHGSLYHITANSGALVILLFTSLSYNRNAAIDALVIIIICSGICVWLFGGSNTVHIGASGVIFGLIGFLLFSSVFSRDLKSIFFSIIIFILYGGTLFTLLKYQPGISWSGHAFGFISGILAAWLTNKFKED